MGSTPELDQTLQAYDYPLPETLIAQTPLVPRDRSRLLVVQPAVHQHRVFQDLVMLLQPGDLLVFNDTRVIPARLIGRKINPTLTQPVEVFLLEPRKPLTWLALVKPGRRLKPGAQIEFGPPEQPLLRAVVLATDEDTRGRVIQFEPLVDQPFEDLLEQLGEVPLPPYIQDSGAQPEQYQTVYAQHPGAVAAPTAGLHFTPELLDHLQAQGIRQARLTLHVGIGTFRPVETDDILQHHMHSEWVNLPATTVDAIKATKAAGGRVIAVGTTVTRALEGACHNGPLTAWQGRTNLFIYPGYQWRVVDGLITNFHLPKSSLLMLVSALVGRERLLALYKDAIAHQYRFYSFGDAMLILPEAVIAERAPDPVC
ncbi:tRNA preQ1(34) S-adenosylmethionine ribosyltransferase-isomerase QueA [Acaryochloris sp. IP29b_bin.148]|uniref:tRNA preQ1(34) S-adenosylmethionine ribosyltransferase-isomerase QueA n=1 Tax=Acaryochloris sp. IP29b_bin.148 TaxID=2969218 RepID=UPI0026372D08|nr:tRNA preQ1(34) S-adenosylmethionine ribosyltransferase-isomerase QueA [Acaryochloris sp. IP29b_bin.148]